MRIKRKGSAAWQGGLKDGRGAISTASGALKDYPYGFASRFEGVPGTNPEELIGAAHAGCFTMALSLILSQSNLTAERMDTTAEVALEQVEGGFAITSVALTLRAKIPGCDEATFQSLAKRNIATLAQYRFKRIVSCDPHSFHVLKNEYGALGGSYEVLHHTTFIDELVKSGALQLGQSKADSVTYHDPCYLGRYNGEYEAPRNVLRAIGIEVKEMQRSGFRSRCCGGGGGAPITDIPGKQRIPDMRMVDIKETGAELVAVGCPQCTAMLEGVVAPRPEIKDIAELVAEVLIESAEAPAKKPARREEVAGVH